MPSPAPKISFIVSVFNDARKLPCLLWSLVQQTEQDFEIVVADNSADPHIAQQIARNVQQFKYELRSRRIEHWWTGNPFYGGPKTCYHSAEIVMPQATGEFLCFASDDSYYMPPFVDRMYRHALSQDADLVYCDTVMGHSDGHGPYFVMDVAPHWGRIDKTGFILRRELFKGFPDKPQGDEPAGCDGHLIEALVREGIRHAKLQDILVVHN